jgi:hypothetical protein
MKNQQQKKTFFSKQKTHFFQNKDSHFFFLGVLGVFH